MSVLSGAPRGAGGSAARVPALVWIVAGLCALSLAVLWADRTMSVREQRIGVRFVDDVSDVDRRRLEQVLGLVDGEQQSGQTWGYRLVDPSRARVEALVRNPFVADTAHVHRDSLRVELDRPDLWPWVRTALEALPIRPLAVGLPLVTLFAGLAARRQLAPILARASGRAGLTAPEGTALVAALAVVLAVGLVFANGPLRGDEPVHMRQVERLARGDWSLEPNQTTLAGFHAVAAAAGWVTGSVRVPSVRLVVLELSLGASVAFFALARRRGAADAGLKTLQFVFLPILFPQFFLVYTDVASLALVLLTALAASGGRYTAAGLAGLASCLVRQNNVIWVALVFLQAYVSDHGWRRPRAWSALTRYWPSLLSVLGVAAWLAANRGEIAAGDVAAHPLGTPHLGNLGFLLFVAGVLFLPLWWGCRRDVWARLRQPAAMAGLTGAFALYWFGFAADHPYNGDGGFIRNAILQWATASPSHRLVFFLPMAVTLLSLPSLRLSTAGWLVYPATVLFLLPSWLVEQRYFLIPLTLLLADRALFDRRTEWAQVGFSVVTSLVVCAVIEAGTWLL